MTTTWVDIQRKGLTQYRLFQDWHFNDALVYTVTNWIWVQHGWFLSSFVGLILYQLNISLPHGKSLITWLGSPSQRLWQALFSSQIQVGYRLINVMWCTNVYCSTACTCASAFEWVWFHSEAKLYETNFFCLQKRWYCAGIVQEGRGMTDRGHFTN